MSKAKQIFVASAKVQPDEESNIEKMKATENSDAYDGGKEKKAQGGDGFITKFLTACKLFTKKKCFPFFGAFIFLVCLLILGMVIIYYVLLQEMKVQHNIQQQQQLQDLDAKWNKKYMNLERILYALNGSTCNGSWQSGQLDLLRSEQYKLEMEIDHLKNVSTYQYNSLIEQTISLEIEVRANISDLATQVVRTSESLMNLTYHIDLLTLSRDHHVDQLSLINSSLSGLFDHVSYVYSSLSILNSSMLSQNQEIIEIHSSMETLRAVQNVTSHQIVNVTRMLSSLDQQTMMNFRYLDSKFAELNQQILNMSEYVNLLLMTRDEHQRHLDEVDTILSSTSSKLTRIDGHLNQLNSSVLFYSQEISALKTKISTFMTKLSDIKASLTEQKRALDNKNSQQDERLESVESASEVASGDRRSITIRVESLEREHSGATSNTVYSAWVLCFSFILFFAF